MTPTARSLQRLKLMGYQARVLERWNAFARIRQDVFGVDAIGLKIGSPILVVQATSAANHSARRSKLKTQGHAALWTGCGCMLEIWSWAKRGPKGQRKTWQLRREAL